MNKNIQKMESKKEYTAPQMEVMALDVQGSLLDGSTPGGGIICVDENGGCED